MTAGTDERSPATQLNLGSEPISIILNASAGMHGEETRNRLLGFFRAQGRDADIALCKSGENLHRLVEAALRSGARIIAAGGGDGTISTVGGALVGTGAALGVLPLGTLNHFAKDIGIPLELEAAAGNLLGGRVARVDVGEVNGRVFLNNSSLGLYPRVIRQREITREQLGWGKWPAFVWASLVMLRRYPLLEVCLRTREANIRRRTPFVFVGNNEYQIEGFDLGARNRLDGGHLSVYITRDVGRLGLLRLAVRALTSRLRDEKDFDALFVEDLAIETPRKRLRVSTDGEVTLMSSPFRYRVRREALRVIVPIAALPGGVNRANFAPSSGKNS